jgi:Acetyltransferase (GNAT) domain
MSDWIEVEREPSRLQAWNRQLLRTCADVQQYPYWNERLATRITRPRYLTLGDDAYVCLVEVGGPGARIGLVQFGPVSLHGCRLPQEALEKLSDWARRSGFIFLRIQHWDRPYIDEVGSMPAIDEINWFPFVDAGASQLLVRQLPDERETLRTFQEIARRDIKAGRKTGYEVSGTNDPNALREVWPVFERQAKRKDITYRGAETYVGLMEQAREAELAKLFVARLDGQPVNAILMCRSSHTAYNLIGALDLEAIGDRPSPSGLLHWTAMRDLYAAGVQNYNLGTRSGTVYTFKRKFCPEEREILTRCIITGPQRFRLWRAAYGTHQWWSERKQRRAAHEQ